MSDTPGDRPGQPISETAGGVPVGGPGDAASPAPAPVPWVAAPVPAPMPAATSAPISDDGTAPAEDARGAPALEGDSSDRASRPLKRRRKKRPLLHRSREHRRRRLRRHGRRAYIRSVYFLPSMATLGNAICGFAAIYVASLDAGDRSVDPVTQYFVLHKFLAAAYLIFFAMLFDALDGRLARFTRHTTDFGGQLDSLADVVSFGVAPAYIALQVFKSYHGGDVLPQISRLVWSVGALYMSCAALRLARFNVSNEHGEQHHYSFLGLPSPGAGGAVAAFILLQQDLATIAFEGNKDHFGPRLADWLSAACVWVLPFLVLYVGLLMISNIRYPHVVNRYLRGRRSMGRLIVVLMLVLLLIVAHRYVLAVGSLVYALWGAVSWAYFRMRRRAPVAR